MVVFALVRATSNSKPSQFILTGSKSVTRISPKNSNDEVQTLEIGGMMH